MFLPLTLARAKGYLKKGNLIDGIRVALGIYEGAQNLPELDNEDYCLFDGEFNINVQDILQESINNIALKMNEIIKSEKAVLQIFDLIFERIKLYGAEKEDDENSIFYNIKHFETLFQFLLINEATALHLYKLLQKNKFESYEAAYIILNISEILKNEILWIKTAETFSEDDEEIFRRLIEKYKSKKMEQDFNRIAKMAFNNWPDDFDLYLINNLDKQQEKSLYVDALKNYVKTKNKIKYYHILRDYLTDDEKIRLGDDFKNNYNKVFYIQLLETEKRYREILRCAKRNKDSYDLDKLIIPILNIYPSECFTLIVNKNNDALNSYGRNRKTYQSMRKANLVSN